jgi:hypothetical protein
MWLKLYNPDFSGLHHHFTSHRFIRSSVAHVVYHNIGLTSSAVAPALLLCEHQTGIGAREEHL